MMIIQNSQDKNVYDWQINFKSRNATVHKVIGKLSNDKHERKFIDISIQSDEMAKKLWPIFETIIETI